VNCSLSDGETPGLPSPDVADAFVLTFAEVGRGPRSDGCPPTSLTRRHVRFMLFDGI